MNSGSLSKPRTRVVKKLVFLFVLALVALAYVATPILACGGNNNGGNNNGGKNNKGRNNNNNNNNNGNNNGKNNKGKNNNNNNNGNSIGASTKQALADLQNGLNETFTNSSGATITLSSLKPGDTFKINFPDGVSLDATVSPSGKSATVTLPDGTTKIVQVDVVNNKVVLSNLASVQSDKLTDTQLLNAFRLESRPGGGIQLLRINGLSSLQPGSLRPNQKFKIKLTRGDQILNAEYLGNKQFVIDPEASALNAVFISNNTKARVAFPGNKKVTVLIVPAAA